MEKGRNARRPDLGRGTAIKHLAPYLETLYRTSPRTRIEQDPIAILHRYDDSKDIESVGFLTTCFAYGRVSSFKETVEKILLLSGRSFYRYLLTFDIKKERQRFIGIYYRRSRSEDILCFVYMMSQIIRQYGGIKPLFISCYKKDDEDIEPTLARVIEKIKTIDTKPVYGVVEKPPGLLFLIPSPAQNSACKRWNLYLRWMVRPNDGIDFGLWREIPTSKLIIPLDTHIARIGRYLGLTSRKSADWKMAKEITQNLKGIDPIDPLKYDFALCHLGISGDCPMTQNYKKCFVCKLLPACKRGITITRKQDSNKYARL
jgi:uncharacterized protein (TIGR02757 family)